MLLSARQWRQKLFMSMLGAFSEFERSRIGERIREIKQQQRARGEFTGGPPPFGFRHDEQKNLVPVPEQQAAIRQMRRLKAKGLSLRAIAARMADSGVRISHVGVQRALPRTRPTGKVKPAPAASRRRTIRGSSG